MTAVLTWTPYNIYIVSHAELNAMLSFHWTDATASVLLFQNLGEPQGKQADK